MSPRRSLTFRNMASVLRWEVASSPRTAQLEDHPLSAVQTAYSVYSQLTSISAGTLRSAQSEDAPSAFESCSVKGREFGD